MMLATIPVYDSDDDAEKHKEARTEEDELMRFLDL
jgi:hypothetical protein